MAGRTGKRARPAGDCFKCGNKITDDTFLRDRKGDSHVKCPRVRPTPPPWEARAGRIDKYGEDWACIATASNPRPTLDPDNSCAPHEPLSIGNSRFHEGIANTEMMAASWELYDFAEKALADMVWARFCEYLRFHPTHMTGYIPAEMDNDLIKAGRAALLKAQGLGPKTEFTIQQGESQSG